MDTAGKSLSRTSRSMNLPRSPAISSYFLAAETTGSARRAAAPRRKTSTSNGNRYRDFTRARCMGRLLKKTADGLTLPRRDGPDDRFYRNWAVSGADLPRIICQARTSSVEEDNYAHITGAVRRGRPRLAG